MANIATLLNTSPVIDTDETCEITVLALEAKISGLGDTYFGDSANWSSIQVEYRSGTGRQREVVTMDVVSPTSSGTFRVSAQARQEAWVIHEIRVKDFDGDFYAVKKADMIPADYNEPTISSGAPAVFIDHITAISLVENTHSIAGDDFVQSFTHTSGSGTYDVNSIDIILRQSNMTGDIQIGLYSAPTGGAPFIATNPLTVDAYTVAQEVNLAFASPYTLTDGVTYFLRVESVSMGGPGPANWSVSHESSGTYIGNEYSSTTPLASDLGFRIK